MTRYLTIRLYSRVLDSWEDDGTGKGNKTQLRQEGSSQSSSADASEGSHGVGGDTDGLVAEGGGREVVQEVGQGGGQGAVVLGGHDHEPLRLLDGLVGDLHPLGGRGLVLHEM